MSAVYACACPCTYIHHTVSAMATGAGMRAHSARRADPGVRRRDQDAEPPVPPPQRHGLLVAGELRRDLARDVAELVPAVRVPDADRVRIVLVLRLRHEREPLARIEAGLAERLRSERDARDRDDANPRVLPPNPLVGGGVAELVTAARPLEPEPQPVAHRPPLPDCIVAQQRVHALDAVHDLRNAEIDDHARKR